MSSGNLKRFLWFSASLLLASAMFFSWYKSEKNIELLLLLLSWIPVLWVFIILDFENQRFDEKWNRIDEKLYGGKHND